MKNPKVKLLLLVIVTAFVLGLCSCNETREADACKWIETHKKPIVAKLYVDAILGNVYTLISADGTVYSTSYVDMILPDTIK
jgi:hypothetical protein